MAVQFETKWSQVRAEVKAYVEPIGSDEPADPGLIASAVLSGHAEVDGPDKDFLLCAAHRAIRKEAVEQLNDHRPEDDAQIALPGFEYLQARYEVLREENMVSIPVEQMSDEELEAKADEYDRMGLTLMEHAREIRRYKDLRGAVSRLPSHPQNPQRPAA